MQYQKVLPEIYDTIQANGGDLVYPVLAGCEDRTFRTYLCENHSNDVSQWDIVPPNKDTIVNKRIMCEVPITLSVSHAAAAVWPVNLQPRAYAPLTGIDNVTLGVNGKENSYNLSELIQILTRYNNPHETADNQWSGCLTIQDYKSLDVPIIYGGQIPRTHASYTLTADGAALKSRVYILRFPIPAMGLEWGNDTSNDGLTLLSRLSLRLRWSTNLAAALFDASEVGAGMTLTAVPSKPTLTLEYITPSVKVNKEYLSFNVKDYQVHRSIIGNGLSVANNAVFTSMQSSTISYSNIPSAVYIYAAEPVTDLSVGGSHRVFSNLTDVKINWMNKAINFQSTEISALEAQAVANGFNVPLNLQAGYAGHCFKFLVGRDLPLTSEQYPGAAMGGTVQVTVSGKNQALARKLNLYVVLETDATMTLVDGNSDVTYGFSNEVGQVLASAEYSPEVAGSGVMGGSFKKPLKKHLLYAWKQLMNHKSEFLGDLNKSMGIAQKYKALQGGSMTGGNQMGGRMIAGSYQPRF